MFKNLPETSDDIAFYRRRLMVDEQLRARGICDKRVLAAMEEIPRHEFVPKDIGLGAYEDRAIPIGENQTISQPYMVAAMTELLELKSSDKVLEVGTGSGYQSAVLSLLCREVFTIERISKLYLRAKEILECGYLNVHVRLGDGSLGLSEEAPFDAIVVTAAAPEVPVPLMEQLAEGGRLVVPVGPRSTQSLVLVVRHSDNFETKRSTPCVFVPLLGCHGFQDNSL